MKKVEVTVKAELLQVVGEKYVVAFRITIPGLLRRVHTRAIQDELRKGPLGQGISDWWNYFGSDDAPPHILCKIPRTLIDDRIPKIVDFIGNKVTEELEEALSQQQQFAARFPGKTFRAE